MWRFCDSMIVQMRVSFSQDIRECYALENSMCKVDVVDFVCGLVLSHFASDVIPASNKHYRSSDLLIVPRRVCHVVRQFKRRRTKLVLLSEVRVIVESVRSSSWR